MKKIVYWLILLCVFLFPITIFAYSDHIIVGGETIGIEVHSNGIYVVGFYDVSSHDIAREAGFEIGDIIKKIDSKDVVSISDLNEILSEEKNYKFQVLRKDKNINISLDVVEDESVLKTGLYVKDQINGIGTLSYIDPETKIFGSLGHEILESNSMSKFQIENGKIYKAEVSAIKKSSDGRTGEKSAIIDKDEEKGNIVLNEEKGIFGIYNDDVDSKEVLSIAEKEEIKQGKATIRTVLEDSNVKDFDIRILSIDESSSTKNIFFEIVDDKLLKKTGGIVQGMSGSPILQNNKIIGVVNYVVVEDASKGYGIFITSMLEEGDKILS